MSREAFKQLQQGLEQVIIGQTDLLECVLITLLAGGHLLVEGPPGVAKTTLIKAVAELSTLDFQRIQFTPDMIPADVTGSDIYLADTQTFKYIKGPIFHNLILADEINRAPPKVQSALLEAMQEQQVTVGGSTRPLPEAFMVMATQNPFEQEGTYPLPEAQMDRFLMRVEVGYPEYSDEQKILQHMLKNTAESAAPLAAAELTAATPLFGINAIKAAKKEVLNVFMDDMVEKYLVKLIDVTRHPETTDSPLAEWISRGVSPRATLALAHTARARAWLHGRDFVDPGDIRLLAYNVLGHRLQLSMTAFTEQISRQDVVRRLLDSVPVP